MEEQAYCLGGNRALVSGTVLCVQEVVTYLYGKLLLYVQEVVTQSILYVTI